MIDPNKTTDANDLAKRALDAWTMLKGSDKGALKVEVLQHEEARSVCRIFDNDVPRKSVIAKIGPEDQISMEGIIYDRILPRLPFPSLSMFGSMRDVDNESVWIFIEDAGGEEYSSDRKDHRALVGKWMANLHTSANALLNCTDLRGRGTEVFGQHLNTATETIQNNLSNPHLRTAHIGTLNRLLHQLETLSLHWNELEDFSDRMPKTLVHGDLKEDNMRIRSMDHDKVLMAFDWNNAGWGIPALDLSKFLGYSVAPDIATYCEGVKRHWRTMDIETVYRIGWVGEIFRVLASIRWKAEELAYEWVDTPMEILSIFSDWFADTLRAEPWAEQPKLGPSARAPIPRDWH